ncbi:MAG: class I SAM-dependent methyltransferase [Phycisphaerales bacterium]|nr:class I SAM-dependent methyltransferase [Phycisphaerales bacterium]
MADVTDAIVPPWWEHFFHGVAVDLWMACCNEANDGIEADFIEAVLQLPPGGEVLDVPCGHGRHACLLASRGHRVTGVDLSTDFLNAARNRTAGRAAAVRWEQRDMRDLPWANEFDGAYCFGNSFGYLDRAGNAAFVEAVGRTLKPGARFVIDTGLAAESVLPHLREREWYEIGGIHFLIQNRYDPATGRLETDYIFHRDGKTDKRHGSQQVYTYREACRVLSAAGFEGIQGYSSPSREPYTVGCQRLLLTGRHRG